MHEIVCSVYFCLLRLPAFGSGLGVRLIFDDLVYAGLSDWTLLTVPVLTALLGNANICTYIQKICFGFDGDDTVYWSASDSDLNVATASTMQGGGGTISRTKVTLIKVRCVRG